MKKVIFLLLFAAIKVSATNIHISVIHYYKYESLSEWNQMRYNLAESIKSVHGDLRMYDNYCKVLNCESDGWTNARNPKSTATGLFQCMKSTFSDMRTRQGVRITFDQFGKLKVKDQAKYFDEYLRLYPESLKLVNTKADMATRQVNAYLMVLKPAAVGRKWHEPVFIKGKSDYNPNSGIPHKGGVIKVADVYAFCVRKFKRS